MKRGKLTLALLAITLAFAGVSGSGWGADNSGEVPWVKPPSPIEQLTGGKVHTGDTITAQNVDLGAPYLLDSFVSDVKDGATITIAPTDPTSQILAEPIIKATIANADKADIAADGTVKTKDGKAWIGGFPAEFPKTAIEVMANSTYQYLDQNDNTGDELWINPEGKAYKNVTGAVGEYYMNGRTCTAPLGAVPGYEDEFRRDLIYDVAPYDVKGIAVLTVEYVDQSKLPDAWGYIPVLRRVQRFSSAQRYDSVDGSDLRAGDLNGFSDPLAFWNYRLIARKPMLFPISPGYPHPEKGAANLKFIKGKYLEGMKMEVRDVYIIETTPKDPSYIYSKKILEIDAGTYLSLGDFYDKQGKLWIAFEPFFTPYTCPCGGNAWPLAYIFRNFQTGSVTYNAVWQWGPDDPKTTIDKYTLHYISSQSR